MRWIALMLVISILLVIPVKGEFENTRKAVIDTTLATEVGLEDVKGPMTATISFFPKTMQKQAVEKPKVESTHEVEVKLIDQTSLELKWKEVEGDRLGYSTSFRVGTFSSRKDLVKQPFPLQIEEGTKQFLVETEYIRMDKEIQELADKITENMTDSVEATFAIANWVRENIEYNISTLTEDISRDAGWVLEKRTGVCDELTVLFLALTRAAGIPSRYVTGVAHTSSMDFDAEWIPHAWAEVYLGEWIPFDLTYGQFGWVDASHIIMKTSGHVDDPSIKYIWQDGDIQLGEVKFDSKVIEKIPINITPLQIRAKPLTRYVYPGGIIPIVVSIKNPTDMRIPTTVRVTKTPGLIGNPTRPVLMEGQSEKEIFYLVSIPDRIESTYDYSAPFVIEDSYGARTSTTLDFSTSYGQLTESQARIMVENYKRGKKESTGNQMYCAVDKNYYSKGDIGLVLCEVNAEIVCMEGNCKKPRNKKVEFTFTANETKELKITAKGRGNTIVYQHVNVGGEAEMKIQLQCPNWINSDEVKTIRIGLESEKEAQDVFILIEGTEPKQIEDFKGKQIAEIQAVGRDLANNIGETIVYVQYSDEEGVRYEIYDSCPIRVGEIDIIDLLTGWWNGMKRLFIEKD